MRWGKLAVSLVGAALSLKLDPSSANAWEQTGLTNQALGLAFARQDTSILFPVACPEQLFSFPLVSCARVWCVCHSDSTQLIVRGAIFSQSETNCLHVSLSY